MELPALISLLGLGFSLGLLHALDADHIMAVSSLSSRDSAVGSVRKTLGFCLRWSMGHGATLLTLAVLFVVTGTQLPHGLSIAAEKLVGVILIAIGIWIIYSLFAQKIRLEMHEHGDVTHVHLTRNGARMHNHQPVLVGITHGLAGSAPVLALLPAADSGSAPVVIGYVLLFSLGVLASMVVFGLCFGKLQSWLAGIGQKVFQASRLLIGFVSIGFGFFWLAS